MGSAHAHLCPPASPTVFVSEPRAGPSLDAQEGDPQAPSISAGRSSHGYSVIPLLQVLGSAPVIKSSPTPFEDGTAGNYGYQFRFQIDL